MAVTDTEQTGHQPPAVADRSEQLAVKIPEGEMKLPSRHRESLIDFEGMTLPQVFGWVEKFCQSNSVNANYRGKPVDAVLAADRGMRLGFSFLDSLDAFAIINGRATIWGDYMLGIVYRSGLLVGFEEKKIGTPGSDSEGWSCTVRRRGFPGAVSNEFTIGDAKVAKLLDKEGPWQTYGRSRMTKWRARSWSLRDLFADVLKGLVLPDEVPEVQATELRTQIADAPSRGDAAVKMLDTVRPAIAGEQEAPGGGVEELLDQLARNDPDFKAMGGQAIRDFVNMESLERKVPESERSAIEKATPEGRLTRDNIVAVVRGIRARGFAPSTPAAPTDEIPADPSSSAAQPPPQPPPQPPAPPASAEPAKAVEGEYESAADLAKMTPEQLEQHCRDYGKRKELGPNEITRVLKVYGDDGRVPNEEVARRVLARIDKVAGAAA